MNTSATPNDSTLQVDVRQALAAALGAGAATIEVAVSRGVATLTGVVAECRLKFAAAERAGAVLGVAGVTDQVEVMDPADQECGDDSTARACAAVLAAGGAVPCGGAHLMRHALVRLARAAAARIDAETAERAMAAAVTVTTDGTHPAASAGNGAGR